MINAWISSRKLYGQRIVRNIGYGSRVRLSGQLPRLCASTLCDVPVDPNEVARDVPGNDQVPTSGFLKLAVTSPPAQWMYRTVPTPASKYAERYSSATVRAGAVYDGNPSKWTIQRAHRRHDACWRGLVFRNVINPSIAS